MKNITYMKNTPYLSLKYKTDITLKEKSEYIKNHLHLTISPIGNSYAAEQIDKMMYLIKNDWKESGHYHHEWIETIYRDMVEINLKNKIK